MTASDQRDRLVTIVAHLSGRFRGKIHRLWGDRLRIGTGPDDEIRFSTDDLTPGLTRLPRAGPYAVLVRSGETWRLDAAPEADIWVNGRRVERRLLDSGDVIEIGEGGPVLRFRLYPPGSQAYKSVSQVFADCVECVRHGRGPADRAGALIAGAPRALLTHTSPVVRAAIVVVVVALAAVVGALWTRSGRLERRLQEEIRVVEGLSELLARQTTAPTEEDVAALRGALSEGLARIEALEALSEARRRVIAGSAGSVLFVLGGWGFEDADGRPLRFARLLPDGTPYVGPQGPPVTLEGDGPPIEILFTGTAFVADDAGGLLTNRHVAVPWEYDDRVERIREQGLSPVMRRFLAFAPGGPEPVSVQVARVSGELDVALLRSASIAGSLAPLPLAGEPPRSGDEVIVLGYPTGLNALLARADPALVEEITRADPADVWQLARRLASSGLIAPLATAGVVGQVTPTSIVYDAETTHGGSGGPVLALDGSVLAINAAVLPEFGGSNLGVPAQAARPLLHPPPP